MTDKFPKWFNPQVSIGNILQGIVFAVAIGIAWGTLRAEQAAQARRLDVVEQITAAINRNWGQAW